MSAKKGLTEKQKRFIDYYIETGNQTEAARLAGYKQPHVQGAQNLEKLRVYIAEKLKAKDSERIASQDEVLTFLTSVMRDEQEEEVVVVEQQGDYTSKARIVKKKANVKDRIKAAENIGKLYATSAPKLDTEDDPLSASLKALAGELDGVDNAD